MDHGQDEDLTARDGNRIIRFTGSLVGAASSKGARSSTRWTEMNIYHTKGGAWIVEKIGRSRVYHSPLCTKVKASRLPRFQEAHPGHDPEDGYEACSCVPADPDITALIAEEDRFWASVCETPEALVSSLHRRKDGVRRLPYFCQDMVDQLVEKFPEIKAAVSIQTVD